jgi:nucleoside-diphosphate-sugar epimerase
MATISVVGASKGMGKHVVEQLRDNGDSVVAVCSTEKEAKSLIALGAQPVAVGDVDVTLDDLVFAFSGSDAVVFAAGSDVALACDASITSVEAAEIVGIKRFVQLAPPADYSGGVRRDGAAAGAATATGSATATGAASGASDWDEYFAAYRAADRNLRTSSLDWTILEPSGLADATPTGHVEIAESGVSRQAVSHADAAATVVATLDDPRTVGRAWEVGAGDTEITEAIETLVSSPESTGTGTGTGSAYSESTALESTALESTAPESTAPESADPASADPASADPESGTTP